MLIMANMMTIESACVSEGEEIVWRFINNNFDDSFHIWMNTRLMIEREGI